MPTTVLSILYVTLIKQNIEIVAIVVYSWQMRKLRKKGANWLAQSNYVSVHSILTYINLQPLFSGAIFIFSCIYAHLFILSCFKCISCKYNWILNNLTWGLYLWIEGNCWHYTCWNILYLLFQSYFMLYIYDFFLLYFFINFLNSIKLITFLFSSAPVWKLPFCSPLTLSF